MEPRKVLIADPSAELVQVLCERLGNTFHTFRCRDGLDALALLERERPHLLVVDLTLPGVDGLSVLRSASSMSPRPAFLVTTRFLSPYIEKTLSELEVDYVMRKPCDIPTLAERVADLLSIGPAAPVRDPSIANALTNLDISSHRRGFSCLELAVLHYMEKPGLSMTKELYPVIAEELGRSPSCVERSIRGCIHGAWEHRNEKIWRVFFQTDQFGHVLRPTNTAFIAAVATHLLQVDHEN